MILLAELPSSRAWKRKMASGRCSHAREDLQRVGLGSNKQSSPKVAGGSKTPKEGGWLRFSTERASAGLGRERKRGKGKDGSHTQGSCPK